MSALMRRNLAPAVERLEQAVDGALQGRRVIAHLTGLSESLIDRRVERDDAADEFAPLCPRGHCVGTRQRESTAQSARDVGRHIDERCRQPPRSTAEIGPGLDDPRARDADTDFGGAPNRQHEYLIARASCGAEDVGGDDDRGVAGERRRVRSEVAEQGRDEDAETTPQCEEAEKRDTILRKARGQHHDHCGADHRADHTEPAFAQRSPKLRLTHHGCGGTGPKWIVEVEPKRNEKGEADGGPHP